MKILHVINQLGYGGTEKNLYNIIRSTSKYQADKFSIDHSIVVLKNEGERFKDFLKICDVSKTYNKELVDKNDIIHIHRAGWTENEFLEPIVNKPIVETNVFAKYDDSEMAKKISIHLLLSNDSINTLINNAGGHIPQDYCLDVVYFPVADEFFKGKPKFNSMSVGRISRADDTKWHDVCLRCASSLSKKYPSFDFHVIGMTNRLKALAYIYGLHRMKEYNQTSNNQELISVLEKMCVFIHGSIIGETFGLAIAEAMAVGLPIVTFSTPGIDNAQTELVSDGCTGFVCKDFNDYFEKTEMLLNNRELAYTMGQRGKEKARLLYSEEKIARKMNEIYGKL